MKRFSVFLMNLIVGLSFSVQAQQNTSPSDLEDLNPFHAGLNHPPLTQDQINNLATFTETSVERLRRALDLARGKTVEEARDIYLAAVNQVLIDSFKGEDKRRELPMRIALAQAKELTYGVLSPDGTKLEKRGILQGTENKDLLIVILEDSVRLAVEFAPKDLKAIKSGDLQGLPYLELAFRRFELGRVWLSATFNWYDAHKLTYAIIRHWFNIAASGENLHQDALGEPLQLANDLLYHNPEHPMSYRETVADTRRLRDLIDQIHAAGVKLNFVGADQDEVQLPRIADRAQPESAVVPVADQFSVSKALAKIAGLSARDENVAIMNMYNSHKDYFDEYPEELIRILAQTNLLERSDDPLDGRFLNSKIAAEYLSRNIWHMSYQDFCRFRDVGWNHKLIANEDRNNWTEAYIRAHLKKYRRDELETMFKDLDDNGEGPYRKDRVRNRLLDEWLKYHPGE